ncbi:MULTISPECIES: ribbon-helix-helix domain-containing protein [Peribacillus]|uniref:ribbon-helix-helix domain-containing protein n=1 Tax=Peribacillus TaxID=2675229 RepID=UPI001F4EB4A5|nr:ribbon-helix-helix domain-containing protein [Peribacillus sp. Aquil_B1]MCK2010911.1 ribbon-helix-helix domain-containing protein [Peribacillus sp. Aquil_B8]
MERLINSESRIPINITLNPYLANRLTNLAEERNIPIERLMDKAVDLLLEYMEDNETVNQVKYSNIEAIEKNKESIAKSREFINKKTST